MSDEEKVCAVANDLEISEYSLFEEAATYWNSPRLVHYHFVQYLLYDDVPAYVRDYCRKHLGS